MSRYTEAGATLRIDALVAFFRWHSSRDPEVASRVLQNNKVAFTRAWGPHLCTFLGSEHRHFIWKRAHGTREFFVLTGRRGTTVEALVAAGAQDTPSDEQINAMLDEILAVATEIKP